MAMVSRGGKLLRILVSALLMGWLLSMVPVAELSRVIAGIQPAWVAAGMGVSLLMRYLNSLQMVWIIGRQRARLSAFRIFVINLITSFYGLFLPGVVAGGAIRWYQLTREGLGGHQALAAMLFNRLFETLSLLAFGLAFLLIDLRSHSEGGYLAAMLWLLALSTGAYLLCFSTWAQTLLGSGIARLPPTHALRQRVERVIEAVALYNRLPLRFQLRLWLINLVRHGIGVVSIVFFAHAIGVEVGFATLAWIRSIFSLLMLLPLSISGLGIREATFVGVLALYGIPAEEALTLSLLVFLRGFFYACIGGLFEAKRVLSGRRDLPPLSQA